MTNSRTKIKGSTIAIIVLSILLLTSIAIGAVLAYFTANQTVVGTVTLGDPVTINITQGGASAASLTFSGNALPGTVYDQAIGVSAPASMTDALMRAKLTLANTSSASQNIEATTTNDWTYNEDDQYYYYGGVVSANASINFVTAITVPTTLTNDDANKTYNVQVIVETIQQANNAANTVWSTAPSAWLTQYSPAST